MTMPIKPAKYVEWVEVFHKGSDLFEPGQICKIIALPGSVFKDETVKLNQIVIEVLDRNILRKIPILIENSSLGKFKLLSELPKAQYEAVSGDQSLFDLIDAPDACTIIAKAQGTMGAFCFVPNGMVLLAERKAKKYIPSVNEWFWRGGTNTWRCVAIDKYGSIFAYCEAGRSQGTVQEFDPTKTIFFKK